MTTTHKPTAPITLSVAVIARDEERHIGGCLASVVDLADEVVVLLDNRSQDRTQEICIDYGAGVHIEPWRGYPAQRNRALQLCQGDWVLFVDADERLTPALRQDVRHITLSTAPATTRCESPAHLPATGYWIPRHNIFFGQRLRGGGWYPDHQLRLLRRTHAHYDESRLVHELVHLDGEAGQLDGHLLHYNIEHLHEFWHKQTQYALAEAHTLYAAGQQARPRNLLGAPAREFWRRYIRLGGWRDGLLGMFLCASLAWFEVVKFSFLWSLQHSPRAC